jgi:hypothetical protein
MPTPEWLYQQRARKRRESEMRLMQQMQAEQTRIQSFLLLNTDTMTYMPGGSGGTGATGI